MKIGKPQLSVILVLAVIALIRHYFFYAPVVERRHTEDSLRALQQAVAAGDTARLRATTMQYLSDDAHIHLEIFYTHFENEKDNAKPAITYDFTKGLFDSYLTNLFGSLSGFTFQGQVKEFTIGKDWDRAKTVMVSTGSAVGTSRFMARERAARFSFSAICEVELELTGDNPIAREVDCRMFTPRPQPLP